jgi:zinc protease
MKKIIVNALILGLSILSSDAQVVDFNTPLPVDEKVRIGQLENGFTYYIRENKKPENRIEMRLAVNAGSILETEEQLGLAHLLEHMAFNGTKHFEKNELIQYLQSIGVKFGPDLNAYTSFDETVYMLTIPSDSAELVDKGFLVMEDWAFNQTLDAEEIDKERGVVIEEWRLGQGPWKRMLDKNLPVIFKDSRYANRLPIGKKEVIESFEHDVLRSFYKDWYRPNLMALAIVGDIDADVAEAKIKEHFSKFKNPENEKERKEYGVPDHEGTLITIATDVEAPVTLVRLMYKADVGEQKTEADYLQMVKESCISGMLNRRLQELTEKAEPPFVNAGFYYGGMWSRNKNALQGYALLSEAGIEKGLTVLLEENNRIAQFGFTDGELHRYKLDYLKRLEKAFNEANKTESASLADEYIRNFLEEESIPGIEFEYAFVKANIDKVTLEDVNALAKSLISSDNRIIVVNGPEKEDLKVIEESDILTVAEKADQIELTPYKDKLASATLIEILPKAGEIASEKEIASIGATEITFANGAKVLLKPTTFKNDEIKVTGFAWGGRSTVGVEDHFSALHADGIVSESGLATFSKSDLTKILAGKTAYAANTIGEYTQNVSASCRPQDAETMLQLLYLNFTAPRVDDEAFQAYISKNRDLYKNLGQEPMNYFYDKYNRIRSQNHPRGNYLPLEEDWYKVNFQRSIEIYKDLYSNASEFTFVFVGAFDTDTIKPLLAKYIGSLPSTNEKKTYTDMGIRLPKGKVVENIYKGTDPKSLAIVSFYKEVDYNKKDAFLMDQLAQLLNRKYYEILREEMSGVYGVNTRANLAKVPYERASLSISIPCSPDNVDSLIDAAKDEIINIQTNGVEEKEINKSREIFKRALEKNLQENSYWLGSIKECYMKDIPFEMIGSFDIMEDITSDELKRVANQYVNLDEYLQVVLYPEEMKK